LIGNTCQTTTEALGTSEFTGEITQGFDFVVLLFDPVRIGEIRPVAKRGFRKPDCTVLQGGNMERRSPNRRSPWTADEMRFAAAHHHLMGKGDSEIAPPCRFGISGTPFRVHIQGNYRNPGWSSLSLLEPVLSSAIRSG
jgi:hypothetical protein